MTDTKKNYAIERLAAFADWLSPEDEDKLLELDGVDFKAEDAQSIIADLKTQSAEIERLRAALSYAESMISKWVGDHCFDGSEEDRAIHARDVARKTLKGSQ